MTPDHRQLNRAGRAIWVAIAAVAAADLTGAMLQSFEIAWGSFAFPALVCSALAAAGWFYRAIRRDARLAAALTATAQLAGFAVVAAPLSYLAASLQFPLQDAALDGWDRRLACDWIALLHHVTATPWLRGVLAAAYASFSAQAITTVLALALLGHRGRLTLFIAAFIATALMTIALSAVMPATGPWLHYGIDAGTVDNYTAASHSSWPVFLGLRDGTVATLTALHAEGIITFPSLHAALGLLFIMALWTIRGLRWIAVALNAAMIAATPVEGSHYIVDVIAGIALAALAWFAAVHLLTSGARRGAITGHGSAPSIVPDLPSLTREREHIPDRADVF